MAIDQAWDELPLYEIIGLLQSDLAEQPGAVLATAERILAERGPLPWLYALIARAQQALAQPTFALVAAREALTLAPDDVALVLYIVPILLATQTEREAIAALIRIARQEPDSPDVQAALLEAWLAVDERAKAQAARDRLATLDPDDPRLAAFALQLEANDKTSAAYIRTLFDSYADRFDADLMHKLQYVTPEVLAGMLEAVLAMRNDMIIGDLGCGTGLMGKHLRPYAADLIGVDLSPRMLAQAERLALYDELIAGDLVSFLESESCAYDLLVAADVLVYLGDLDTFFGAASAGLKPGGWLAFSVERSDGADYVQLPTRRFAHGNAYLQTLCMVHNFRIEQLIEFQPRREGAGFIDGLAILAQRV